MASVVEDTELVEIAVQDTEQASKDARHVLTRRWDAVRWHEAPFEDPKAEERGLSNDGGKVACTWLDSKCTAHNSNGNAVGAAFVCVKAIIVLPCLLLVLVMLPFAYLCTVVKAGGIANDEEKRRKELEEAYAADPRVPNSDLVFATLCASRKSVPEYARAKQLPPELTWKFGELQWLRLEVDSIGEVKLFKGNVKRTKRCCGYGGERVEGYTEQLAFGRVSRVVHRPEPDFAVCCGSISSETTGLHELYFESEVGDWFVVTMEPAVAGRFARALGGVSPPIPVAFVGQAPTPPNAAPPQAGLAAESEMVVRPRDPTAPKAPAVTDEFVVLPYATLHHLDGTLLDSMGTVVRMHFPPASPPCPKVGSAAHTLLWQLLLGHTTFGFGYGDGRRRGFMWWLKRAHQSGLLRSPFGAAFKQAYGRHVSAQDYPSNDSECFLWALALLDSELSPCVNDEAEAVVSLARAFGKENMRALQERYEPLVASCGSGFVTKVGIIPRLGGLDGVWKRQALGVEGSQPLTLENVSLGAAVWRGGAWPCRSQRDCNAPGTVVGYTDKEGAAYGDAAGAPPERACVQWPASASGAVEAYAFGGSGVLGTGIMARAGELDLFPGFPDDQSEAAQRRSDACAMLSEV